MFVARASSKISHGDWVAYLVAERLGLTMYRPAVAGGAEAKPSASPIVIAVPSTRAACEPGSRRRVSVQRSRLSPVRILELAVEGKTLFRGWSATRLLMGVPHFLTVCVAPALEGRTAGAQDDHGPEARVGATDPMETAIAGNGEGPRFDLELTMGRLSVEGAAQVVIDACSGAGQTATAASVRLLQDRLEEARLCATVAALRQDEDLAGWRGAGERRRGPRLRRAAAEAEALLRCPASEIESGSRRQTVASAGGIAGPAAASLLCPTGGGFDGEVGASAEGAADAARRGARPGRERRASALMTGTAAAVGLDLFGPWRREDRRLR